MSTPLGKGVVVALIAVGLLIGGTAYYAWTTIGDLQTQVVALEQTIEDNRVAAIAGDVATASELRADVDAIAARVHESLSEVDQLGRRVDSLESTVSASSVDDLVSAVDDLAAAVVAGDAALDSRINELDAALSVVKGGFLWSELSTRSVLELDQDLRRVESCLTSLSQYLATITSSVSQYLPSVAVYSSC